MSAPDKLKIELAADNFFSIPLRKVQIETVVGTGRTYFVLDGKIVAVAKRLQPGDAARCRN
jgi:hypothetical protein